MPYEEAYLLETFLAAVGTNDTVAAETAITDVAVVAVVAAILIVVAVVVASLVVAVVVLVVPAVVLDVVAQHSPLILSLQHLTDCHTLV